MDVTDMDIFAVTLCVIFGILGGTYVGLKVYKRLLGKAGPKS